MLRDLSRVCERAEPSAGEPREEYSTLHSLPTLLTQLAARESSGKLDHITGKLADACKLRVRQQAIAYGYVSALSRCTQ